MRAQRPGESALLLLDAIEILVRQDVPYAVMGAMAASVHGVVRASMDADGPQDVADATAALEADGERIDVTLLRKLAARFGAETAASLETLLASAQPFR